ncbi:MAG: hypothetical protein NTU44_05015 [Bacteroidetes bacterium]|nr:hypothetical protein [Bacteroidota bacterium]
MKMIAIEHEMHEVDWNNSGAILNEEARAVYDMVLKGFIRETYFNDEHQAVLVLECDSIEVAKHQLADLPLVKEGFITFDISVLHPYDGYSRII